MKGEYEQMQIDAKKHDREWVRFVKSERKRLSKK